MPENIDAQDPERTYFDNPNLYQNEFTGLDDPILALDRIDGNEKESHPPFPFTEAFFGPASSPLSPSQYFGNLWDGFNGNLQHQGQMTSFQGPFFSAPSTPVSSSAGACNKGFPFPMLAGQDIGASKVRRSFGKITGAPQEITSQGLDTLRYYAEAIFSLLFPFITFRDGRRVCEQLLVICRDSINCYNSVFALGLYCQQSQLRRFGLGFNKFDGMALKHERMATEGLYEVLRNGVSVDSITRKEAAKSEVQVCASHLLLTQVSISRITNRSIVLK